MLLYIVEAKKGCKKKSLNILSLAAYLLKYHRGQQKHGPGFLSRVPDPGRWFRLLFLSFWGVSMDRKVSTFYNNFVTNILLNQNMFSQQEIILVLTSVYQAEVKNYMHVFVVFSTSTISACLTQLHKLGHKPFRPKTIWARYSSAQIDFYAPNFEKVGDTLVSACPCVCVWGIEISS